MLELKLKRRLYFEQNHQHLCAKMDICVTCKVASDDLMPMSDTLKFFQNMPCLK